MKILDVNILAVDSRLDTKTPCWTTRQSTPAPRGGAAAPVARNTGSGQVYLVSLVSCLNLQTDLEIDRNYISSVPCKMLTLSVLLQNDYR